MSRAALSLSACTKFADGRAGDEHVRLARERSDRNEIL
jgi:hypothetical protein